MAKKTRNEFEIISHSLTNCKIFLVNIIYRTAHTHREFEVCLLLDGEVTVDYQGKKDLFAPGDVWVVNPYQSHGLKAKKSALILTLQVSSAFFNSYYPQISNIEFLALLSDRVYRSIPMDLLRKSFMDIAFTFFKRLNRFELKCTGMINAFFDYLLEYYPHKAVTEKEKNRSRNKELRIRAISEYVDNNFCKKLLLSELAKKENLTLSYLSHFFKDSFGMSFQEYLLRIRCEKARQMLLLTDYTLLDISISCGFSDVKYFNKGFLKWYKCTPRKYRTQLDHEDVNEQKKSLLTEQQFLSDAASITILKKHMHFTSLKRANPLA